MGVFVFFVSVCVLFADKKEEAGKKEKKKIVWEFFCLQQKHNFFFFPFLFVKCFCSFVPVCVARTNLEFRWVDNAFHSITLQEIVRSHKLPSILLDGGELREHLSVRLCVIVQLLFSRH